MPSNRDHLEWCGCKTTGPGHVTEHNDWVGGEVERTRGKKGRKELRTRPKNGKALRPAVKQLGRNLGEGGGQKMLYRSKKKVGDKRAHARANGGEQENGKQGRKISRQSIAVYVKLNEQTGRRNFGGRERIG